MTEQTKAERLADALGDPRVVVFFEQREQAAAELRRLHALNGELLEALKECLPYVRETLLNTGSMDAYYTETKASVAIKKAEGNT